MGIAVPMDDIPELIDRRIAPGTADMAKEPAMTREQAEASIEAGIGLANDLIAKGYNCFLPGEMGIANTTASAAIAAVFCHLTAEQATGRGTNISDERAGLRGFSLLLEVAAQDRHRASEPRGQSAG